MIYLIYSKVAGICMLFSSQCESFFVNLAKKNFFEILRKERVFDRGKGKLDNAKRHEH